MARIILERDKKGDLIPKMRSGVTIILVDRVEIECPDDCFREVWRDLKPAVLAEIKLGEKG